MPPLELQTLQSLKEYAGREIGVSEWLPITQDRIRQFADATEDHQWIHLDAARAQRDSPYRATIAHGFLTLSLLGYFVRQVMQVPRDVRLTVNYGLNKVRFPAAVPSGSEIRARVTLQSFKELPDCVESAFVIFVELKGSEKPCCVAELILRYYQ